MKQNQIEYHKNYYQKNKERIKERLKKYKENHPEYYKEYRKNHSEEHRQYNLRYYKKYSEKAKLLTKKWREKNKEKIRESCKKYRLEHPEKVREYRIKYNLNHPNHNCRNYTLEKKYKLAVRPKPERCEICDLGGKICFDHDHETGEFRGWICDRCNKVLGFVKDDKELLLLIIEYLKIK